MEAEEDDFLEGVVLLVRYRVLGFGQWVLQYLADKGFSRCMYFVALFGHFGLKRLSLGFDC